MVTALPSWWIMHLHGGLFVLKPFTWKRSSQLSQYPVVQFRHWKLKVHCVLQATQQSFIGFFLDLVPFACVTDNIWDLVAFAGTASGNCIGFRLCHSAVNAGHSPCIHLPIVTWPSAHVYLPCPCFTPPTMKPSSILLAKWLSIAGNSFTKYSAEAIAAKTDCCLVQC